VLNERGRIDLRYEVVGYGMCPVEHMTDTICFDGKPLGPIDPAHRIYVRPHKGCYGERARGGTCMGMVTRLTYPCRPCACNVVHALHQRHLTVRPAASRAFVFGFVMLATVRAEVMNEYVAFMERGYDGWFVKWPESKRRALLLSEIWDRVVPERIKAMVKMEGGHDMPTRARLIQFYFTLATQMLFARECYALQHAYAKVLQRYEVAPGLYVTMACGMNSVALGDWMTEVLSERPNAWFYERDGKRWDSTVNHSMHELKRAAYVGVPGFVDFVDRCENVVGHWRSGTQRCKYRSNGCTKSGHNDTTLGNSIINAAITVETALSLGLRGDLIVAGDDMLFVSEGDFDEHAFAREEASYGIIPEYRKWKYVEDVSFISGLWVPVGSTHRFIPKPARLLARLFWTMNPPSWRTHKSYMHSVVAGMGLLADMPVIRVFLKMHDFEGRGLSRTGKYDLKYHGVPAVSCTEYFYRRYQTSPAEVAEVEALVAQCGGKPMLVKHPLFERMEKCDLADIGVRGLL
jgi:hypothetical protein